MDSLILVDAHVHMQHCFSWSQFFYSAYRNFQKMALSLEKDFSAVLLLSEAAGVQYFRDLFVLSDKERLIQSQLLGEWQLFKTEESCSIEVRSRQGESLLIIAGRQIVTLEKLEVLALLSDTQFMDGLPLSQIVSEIKAEGAIPVIPWGAGKWLGGRGKLLTKFIETMSESNMFLGDNGGRPTFWKHPAHFELARSKGLSVLPGSDPLPLLGEVERIGSYGFYLSGKLSTRQPAAELKHHLLSKHTTLTPYGDLRSSLAFCKDQLSIRLS